MEGNQMAMHHLEDKKVLLLSVGGSKAPLLHVLQRNKPQYVWYFCSNDSRAVADEIQAALEWNPTRDYIEVGSHELLGPCYVELRREIPKLLKKWKIEPRQVVLDYTGGTKTMSVALAMAGSEYFSAFSYVGGEQREKQGLGVVIDGREKVVYQSNPIKELAIRDIERIRDLWDASLYDSAAIQLQELSGRYPLRVRCLFLADLALGAEARHRFDFKEAAKRYGTAQKSLDALFDGGNDYGFPKVIEEAINAAKVGNEASELFLRELLENAARTAQQARYEDAAARLYRAVEVQLQLWLKKATDGLFVNGRCRKPEKLSEKLRQLPFCQPDERNEIKLGLENCAKTLDQLGFGKVRRLVEDINQEKKSRFRQASEKRNTSILAHGCTAIDQAAFEDMCKVVEDFLGLRVESPSPLLPPFQTEWLTKE